MNKLAVMSVCAGCLILFAGIVIAAVCFRTPDGAGYSPLNHFVSELGWYRYSRMAWVYNSCLFVSGIMFIPLSWALWRQSRTRLRCIAMVFGICAAIGVCLAAVLPMDIIVPHLYAALIIFLGLLFSVSLFTIAFCLDRKGWMSWTLVAAGILLVAICLVLMALPKHEFVSFIKAPDSFARSRLWLLPFVEWSFFASLFLWALTVAAKLCTELPAIEATKGVTTRICATGENK